MPVKNGHTQPPVENYRPLLWYGVILALLISLGTSGYWINETNRLQNTAASLLDQRVKHGSEIFQGQCASCHGVQGEGGVGPALNSQTLLKNTPDEIFFSIIRTGVPNTQMPTWSVDFGGALTDEDIRDIVVMLRAWEPTAPVIVPTATPAVQGN